MATAQVVRDYFAALGRKQGWEAFLADNLVFTSHASASRQVSGREAYLAATRRFFSMISSVEISDLLIDGAKACALTRYELQPPGGHRDVDLRRRRSTTRNWVPAFAGTTETGSFL